MNTKNLYEQLKKDEGVVFEIYLDHLGFRTMGVGHLITESDPEFDKPVGTRISEERVFSAFERDLEISISECIKLYGRENWEGFPGVVQEILVNLMFNMGRPRLSKFKKMNRALIEGDWMTAAAEGRDSLWYRQVTNRAERLMTRLEDFF